MFIHHQILNNTIETIEINQNLTQYFFIYYEDIMVYYVYVEI
jgi:hypothetical protein